MVALNIFKGKLALEAETSSVDVLPEAFTILGDLEMLKLLFWKCFLNVCVHLVFVCMYDYAAACLGQDTLVKEIFNLFSLFPG